MVGDLLAKLDKLGIADHTIVIFITDNGADKFSWPDGGTSPFRGEKGLGCEGGFRVPFLMRWPAAIPAGRVLNRIFSLEDVVPTLMAAVGVPDLKEKLLTGYPAGAKRFRVHLDGYNQLPYLTGGDEVSLRHEFFYYGEHELFAVRYQNWKMHFKSRTTGSRGKLYRLPCRGRSIFALTRSSSTWMPGVPVVRRRKALDAHAGRQAHQIACGHVQGLPAAAGAAGVQS